MSSLAGSSDPRRIVTPEAFQISEELLGRPLARPRARLLALLVDLSLIGLLSQVGGLVLGVVAVVFFFRMATSRGRSDALARVFRGAVGCFGAVVLLVTGCGLLALFGPDARDLLDEFDDDVTQDLAGGEEPPPTELEDVFAGIAEARAFRDAGNTEGAVAAASRMARRLDRVGVPRSEIPEALRGFAPPDAPWRDDLQEVVGRAMANLDVAPPTAPEAEVEEPGGGTAALSDSAASLPEVLRRYAALEAEGEASSLAEREELRSRILGDLGEDTLSALRARLTEEAEGRESAERSLEQARQELQRSQGGPLFGWLRRLVDDLGLAFGWGTIYMTVFLTWWNGRTPGKKLLGIRVLQLDGTPITWWEAFERAGGYAAGFATGLLGFAQVFWDPNRQAIHDKISETVVVVEGAEPAPGLRPPSSATGR